MGSFRGSEYNRLSQEHFPPLPMMKSHALFLLLAMLATLPCVPVSSMKSDATTAADEVEAAAKEALDANYGD